VAISESLSRDPGVVDGDLTPVLLSPVLDVLHGGLETSTDRNEPTARREVI